MQPPHIGKIISSIRGKFKVGCSPFGFFISSRAVGLSRWRAFPFTLANIPLPSPLRKQSIDVIVDKAQKGKQGQRKIDRGKPFPRGNAGSFPLLIAGSILIIIPLHLPVSLHEKAATCPSLAKVPLVALIRSRDAGPRLKRQRCSRRCHGLRRWRPCPPQRQSGAVSAISPPCFWSAKEEKGCLFPARRVGEAYKVSGCVGASRKGALFLSWLLRGLKW